MFSCENKYSQIVFQNIIDDKIYFRKSLELALQHISEAKTKDNCPSVICTTVKGIDADANHVPRKKAHDPKNCRRKFISLDLDFEPGQENDAEYTRDLAIDFARKMETPILIYPTMSYPSKPRYRIILFTRLQLAGVMYKRAVTFLRERFDILDSAFDATCLSNNTNLNLPWFNSYDQASYVYSTLDNENLKPLDNVLWKNVKLTTRKKQEQVFDLENAGEVVYDESRLIELLCDPALAEKWQTYKRFWMLMTSIALAIYLNQLSLSVGDALMEALASHAPDSNQRDKWVHENKEMLTVFISRLNSGFSGIHRIRPLHLWYELSDCVVGRVGDPIMVDGIITSAKNG